MAALPSQGASGQRCEFLQRKGYTYQETAPGRAKIQAEYANQGWPQTTHTEGHCRCVSVYGSSVEVPCEGASRMSMEHSDLLLILSLD